MKPPVFKRHHNRELGKYYHTAKDYYGDLKKRGLAPYDPDSVKTPERKPYKQSEWAKGMLQDIHDRKGRPPSERFLKELDKRGINQKSYELARRLANER